MAWTRNQVMLHTAAEVHAMLGEASIAPVALIGPLAWSLQPREEGAIRTIPNLTLLLPRQLILRTVSTLARHGWTLQSPQPDADTLHWSSHLALTKDSRTLHLHWRICPAATANAIAFEHAMIANLRTLPWRGHRFHVLCPEADLLHRLIDRPSWDPVPWQADVLMSSFAGIDWARLHKLAEKFSAAFHPVDPLQRISDLRRDWDLPIPQTLRPQAQLRTKLGRWGSLLWKA